MSHWTACGSNSPFPLSCSVQPRQTWPPSGAEPWAEPGRLTACQAARPGEQTSTWGWNAQPRGASCPPSSPSRPRFRWPLDMRVLGSRSQRQCWEPSAGPASPGMGVSGQQRHLTPRARPPPCDSAVCLYLRATPCCGCTMTAFTWLCFSSANLLLAALSKQTKSSDGAMFKSVPSLSCVPGLEARALLGLCTSPAPSRGGGCLTFQGPSSAAGPLGTEACSCCASASPASWPSAVLSLSVL